MVSHRTYAIVPAAGRSRRMGRHKLLLPIDGRPLIEHTLRAWLASDVDHVVVVIRATDLHLGKLCASLPVEVVRTLDPPDMRASIEVGLDHVEAAWQPHAHEAWLTAPADMPTLSPDLINHLLDAYYVCEPNGCVPAEGGQLGHPLLLPWAATPAVRALPAGVGLNALSAGPGVNHVACGEHNLASDIDTPEDYRRFRASHRLDSRPSAGC